MTLQRRLNESEFEKASTFGKPPVQMLDGLRQQFDEAKARSMNGTSGASGNTTVMEDEQISLQSAVIYDDRRAHFVYSDKTALILHPNGDCVTLFTRNGQKVRQLVQYVTNSAAKESSSGALSKMILAL